MNPKKGAEAGQVSISTEAILNYFCEGEERVSRLCRKGMQSYKK